MAPLVKKVPDPCCRLRV